MGMKFGVEPMKAALGVLPSLGDDGNWAYEIKWDGYRTVAFIDHGTLRLQSSNQLDVTTKYPELADLAASVHAESAVIDGEIVVLDNTGKPNFGLLQRHAAQVVFYAFDVLELNGIDTTGLPYESRRALLTQLLEPATNWSVPAHRVGDGAELLELTRERGLEGVMAKRLGSTYVPGKRSPNWRKVKNRIRQTLVVGGWCEGSGSRQSTFGSLLLGVRDHGRDGLRFAGAVGTGFDQARLESLMLVLRDLAADVSPFTPVPPKDYLKTAHWIRPELHAIVEFAEWTNDGVVRHASFIDLS